MQRSKYRIYKLSARAVMSYAERDHDGVYSFVLDRAATDRCKVFGASHIQESNALFFQIMNQKEGDDWREPSEGIITDLADVIFYMDFSGVFDCGGARSEAHQQKARDMFRPDGVCLDLGGGLQRYVAFERSSSMSRDSRLSFIRADYYAGIRRRMMLDLQIGPCQLSKLYAYNGLMLSGGVRVEGIDIDKPHRVIVVDNPYSVATYVKVITVADQSGRGNVRCFQREEKETEKDFMLYDGEGLVSKKYAGVIDSAYCGRKVHSSFQIRLPFIKGMLHQIDFQDILRRMGAKTVTDIWGVMHPIKDVDIILTKSQFKGYGWLTENGKTWEDYWDAFRRYRHALYITNVSKEEPEAFTELNYQFLNTISLTAEEFRPAELPAGWTHSPAEEERPWLTKETELAYYRICADEQARRDYFLYDLNREDAADDEEQDRREAMARVLKRKPLFIHEPAFTKELEAQAERIIKRYAMGRLIVAGDNRFLSGDLLEFLAGLVDRNQKMNFNQRFFHDKLIADSHFQDSFFAPGAVYESADFYTLLRSPHIARNEEVQMPALPQYGQLHRRYLAHLTDVVVVDYHNLIAERLGGADYDGDMVKTVADPIVNKCVWRNYRSSPNNARIDAFNLPLLMIPTVEPLLADADDWQARFETVRNTFSSRVGQICNAALDRSVIAYNENSTAEERRRCREETELLAILVGLEIDAAKSGVRPDLTEYLGRKTVPRTAFLKYKRLAEKAETRRAWYEPTHAAKLKAFFRETDWSRVDSNLERLPWLAYQLKKHTPRIKPKPAKDEELFTFAQEEGWQDKLDAKKLAAIDGLLHDYDTCLARIRISRAPLTNQRRRQDIQRILYARGQEELYDVDELYAWFGALPAERVAAVLAAVREQQWQFLDGDGRGHFLLTYLPEAALWLDLLTDFRYGGYRVLGDLLCDLEEENQAQGWRRLHREQDSPALAAMLNAYAEQPGGDHGAAAKECREQIKKIVTLRQAVRYLVALGRRDLLWELLPFQIEKEVRHAQ